MTNLTDFLNNYDEGYSFFPDEALYAAKEDGLIKEFKELGTTVLGDRRWGETVLYVFEVDGVALGIQVYVMHNDEAEDLFETVYPVESYQVVDTRWRKING